jgi:epoxyqueuosine reductase QueG
MATKKGISKANAEVQDTLSKLDVDMVGVARLSNLKDTKLKESALKLLPSARSIVVVGMEVYPEFLDLISPERVMGTANLNDMYNRHVEYLRGRLTRAAYEIARASRNAGLKSLPLSAQGPAVDGRFLEAVISYKHAAEAAGLGRIGMSSLLVTQKFGPRVNLTVCLTEAILKSTADASLRTCRFCNVCIAKCPSHALDWPKNDEPYVINKFACRTYIDAAGGCSECMRQCPVASPRYE